MIKELLTYNKETGNKYRWQCDCDGVRFNLYIPKWRIPEPFPKTITATIHTLGSGVIMGRKYSKEAYEGDLSLRKRPVKHRLVKVEDHTETVRFNPYGNREWWDIGSAYIPAHKLPSPDTRELYIVVKWK